MDETIHILYDLAEEKAETETRYRIELSKSLLQLKSEGCPMAIIGDTAKARVYEELFKRDLMEARFTATREALITYRSQLSAIQTVTKIESEI
jgi:hypothetical protein